MFRTLDDTRIGGVRVEPKTRMRTEQCDLFDERLASSVIRRRPEVGPKSKTLRTLSSWPKKASGPPRRYRQA